MGDVKITDKSVLKLKDGSTLTLKDNSALTVKSIDEVKNIGPVAVHLKEVNHIDPLSIESLHVSEVKNIEPIEVSKFHITNLPMLNVSLQKLPAVDFNVKSLPPVSVGLHQNLFIPSSYLLRARLLGFELARLNLDGQTTIIPKERARLEQSRSDNQSFPKTSVAGNPAIPSHCERDNSVACHPRAGAGAGATQYSQARSFASQAPQAGMVAATAHHVASSHGVRGVASSACNSGALSFGTPRTAFKIPEPVTDKTLSEHRVMTGE